MADADDTILSGRATVVDAWREALLGLDDSVRRVSLVDAQFAHWPLNEPAVLDHLAHWLRPAGRQLQIIAQDFEGIARLHPRLARWRRDWVHRISCWQPVEPVTGDWPVLLCTDARAVQVLDTWQWRARVITSSPALQACRLQIDALAQRCEAAWPLSLLGL